MGEVLVLNEETEKLFKMMNLNLDPRTKVSKLPVCQQQMVEIARAVSFNSVSCNWKVVNTE